MRVDYLPAFLLRKYIWDLLKENLGMSEQDYGGLVPIVPSNEEPELTQYSKPYIVYGYANFPTASGEHYRRRGSMSMAIRSNDFHQISNILNVLETAFEREDDAARDVNEYTSLANIIGLRFGTISVGFLEGPAPEETEGGRQDGIINIRYEYYVDYDVTTAITPS